MSKTLESKLADPDMQGAPKALLRAAQRAREIARQTGTALVFVENGVLVKEYPGGQRQDSEAEPAPTTPSHTT